MSDTAKLSEGEMNLLEHVLSSINTSPLQDIFKDDPVPIRVDDKKEEPKKNKEISFC